MKKKKWLGAFGAIDDRFVEDAAPELTRRVSKKALWRRVTAIAACLCILIGANLWLFLPFATTPPGVSRYSASEYYGIIERLNAFAFEKPEYKNNAEQLSASIEGFFSALGPMGGEDFPNSDSDIMVDGGSAPPTSNGGGYDKGESAPSYVEVTDNQVEGVTEGDIFKRSETHIYHLRGTKLAIYTIDGKNSEELGVYGLFKYNEISYQATDNEMYLSPDCTAVTVVFGYKDKNFNPFVDIISLDVTSPDEIKELSRITISGSVNTSRMVGDTLLTLTNYTLNLKALDFSNENTFLPALKQDGEEIKVPAENIAFPDVLTSGRYTVVTKLSSKTLQIEGVGAFLSYAEEAYITDSTVYATRGYTKVERNELCELSRDMSEICALGYSDGIEVLGSVTVEGGINNQYSLDEYEGILRAVTSTRSSEAKFKENGSLSASRVTESANLYCIDLSDMSIRALVESFCPKGEEVTSARFVGNTAYICTANVIQMTDPVYFFDLSNLDDITYKDTGVIDGYSTSLVDFGNGMLLGIGVGGRGEVKVEIYEEGESSVVSVAEFTAYGSISSEHKAHYINRDFQIVGVTVSNFYSKDYPGYDGPCYVLLAFDGFELVPVKIVELDYYSGDLVRAFFEEGFLYIVTPSGLTVSRVFSAE